MNRKQKLLLLPVALLPYMTLLVLLLILRSGGNTFPSWIMKTLFLDNGLIPIGLLLVMALGTALAGAAVCLLAWKEQWNPLVLGKAVMIVKLLQFPAYVAIFALGFMLFISLLTIPFALLLVVIDGITLLSTGLCQAGAVFSGYRQGMLTKKEAILWVLPQFFFCADVVGSVCFYRNMKKTHA